MPFDSNRSVAASATATEATTATAKTAAATAKIPIAATAARLPEVGLLLRAALACTHIVVELVKIGAAAWRMRRCIGMIVALCIFAARWLCLVI